MNLWIQNLLIVGSFALAALLLALGSRNEQWQRAWRRLRRNRLGLVAGAFIGFYLLMGALEMLQLPDGHGGAESVLGFVTSRVHSEQSYSAPFAKTLMAKPRPLAGFHLLGTDALGKDTLVQTLRACRTALLIGGITSAIYIPVGTILGILAGYFRRWTDDIVQYLYGVIASVPSILLLIAIILVLGKSFLSMATALAVTGWVGLCRLIRGETMRQSERPYIAAARALGQSHWNIIVDHILPNVLHLVLITFVLGFSDLVIAEAILSYLGVGLPVGTASWGAMIDGARGELTREPVVWWNLAAASGALFFLVLSLNLFGDALRRAFDPDRG
jgi:peptide/nickel transport system permease protein